jgi:NAD(P)-dependent dehydrogenase (short-subunit alcohol dehydrogenase family)
MLDRFTRTLEKKASLAATVPLTRIGRTEEIAQTIVFLASDKGWFHYGASYVIDGKGPLPNPSSCPSRAV